jgi:hypothetical protein
MQSDVPTGQTSTANGRPTLDVAPRHPFSHKVWRALRKRAERELLTDLRVAILLSDGFAREEVARKLDISLVQVKESCARIADASDYLEPDTDEDVPQSFRGRA